jgi:cell division protein FtsI (penicillin-binding protein 3)
MATALDRGTVGLHQSIDTAGGHWSYKGRRISDTHPVSVPLDPAGVLVHSSNVGMSKVALSMVPPDARQGSAAFRSIRDTLCLLGFGRCPGILSEDYESPGRVTPLDRWTRKYTLVSVSFGNEISVTPVQMAAAFAVLANDGLYVPPRIVERMISPDGTQVTQPAAPACRIFSAKVCRAVRDMLVRVVDEGGSRHVKIKGLKVAGKTGTAEKLPARKEVTSSFVGFAPADDPALLALVVIDEPKDAHLASKVAAPHVMAVLERGLCHLGIAGEGL